jgi:hypothetical protein
MKSLQNNLLLLVIAAGLLGFSAISFINLSQMAIDSQIDAVWSFIAITLTLTGLLVSPVLALLALTRIIKSVIQPALKYKRKRTE